VPTRPRRATPACSTTAARSRRASALAPHSSGAPATGAAAEPSHPVRSAAYPAVGARQERAGHVSRPSAPLQRRADAGEVGRPGARAS
jgi:hypothetical protein